MDFSFLTIIVIVGLDVQPLHLRTKDPHILVFLRTARVMQVEWFKLILTFLKVIIVQGHCHLRWFLLRLCHVHLAFSGWVPFWVGPSILVPLSMAFLLTVFIHMHSLLYTSVSNFFLLTEIPVTLDWAHPNNFILV